MKVVRSQTGVSQHTWLHTPVWSRYEGTPCPDLIPHVPDGYNYLLERLAVHLVDSEPSPRNEVARLTERYASLQVICLLQRHEQTESLLDSNNQSISHFFLWEVAPVKMIGLAFFGPIVIFLIIKFVIAIKKNSFRLGVYF